MCSGASKIGNQINIGDSPGGMVYWPALGVLAGGDVVTARLELRDGREPWIGIKLFSARDAAVVGRSEVHLRGHRACDVYRNIAVTALSRGSFLVSWTRHSYQADAEWAVVMMAQEFDAAARSRSDAFVVNDNSTGVPQDCSVTPLSQGGCVVVWSDESSDGGSDVRAALVSPETRGLRFASHALSTIDLKNSEPGTSA